MTASATKSVELKNILKAHKYMVRLKGDVLGKVLNCFKGKQRRIINGIHNNQGIYTHTVQSNFHTNNVSTVAAVTADRLAKLGFRLICLPQDRGNELTRCRLTRSYHWYMIKDVDIAWAA